MSSRSSIVAVAAAITRVIAILSFLCVFNLRPSFAGPIALSFGSNENGRTGQNTESGNTLVATPVNTTNLAGVSILDVDAGGAHSLLLGDNGTVYSFGISSSTGIDGVFSSVVVPTPINMSNLAGRQVTHISAGTQHSLLLTSDGSVFSFGSGQIGRNAANLSEARMPGMIDTTNLGGRTISQVSAGFLHSLLLADDGSVFSFGNNLSGATGRNVSSGSTAIASPIDATNLAGKTFSQVSAGGELSLLLAEDGTVFSFGENDFGQTGLGVDAGDTLIATPIDMTNLADRTITQVSAGFLFGLLLDSEGQVFCMGAGFLCGLGSGASNALVATPIDTTNLAGKEIVQLAAWENHSLLLASDGSVFAFGSNQHGQSGIGTSVGSLAVATPINTQNLSGLRVIDVDSGYQFGLILATEVPEPGSFILSMIAILSCVSLARRNRRC